MRTKKTVAIFSGYATPHLGGIERYVEKMSEALLKKGFRVVIVTSRHNSDLECVERKGGILVYRLPIMKTFSSRYPLPAWHTQSYRDIKRKVDAEHLDYILLNTRFHLTSLIGARLARKKKIEPMLIEHGTAHFSVGVFGLDILGGWYEHILTFLMKRYVKRFYGVSKKCNEWLAHFGIESSGVLYNAVDVGVLSKRGKRPDTKIKESDGIIITYAGRLIKEKGILNLVDAFLSYKNAHPSAKVTLVIAGDGPLYESLSKKYELNSYIKMLGYLDYEHVSELYRQSDIFVYPSLYPEGLPTSILEAGLAKCAVVATSRGGTEEVIIDSHHGIIIDGSAESIVHSIEVLIEDTELRDRMGRSIQKRVREVFSWTAVENTLENEFTKLIKKI